MPTPMRDLASPEYWERSIERSRHRREITPDVRRRLSRRRRASAALTTLMIAGPTGQALGAIKSDGTPNVGGASPATRAIDTPQRGLMFKVGSNGPTVIEIQRALGVPADGIYGAMTEQAVRDFQARNGLLIDGVVGPATWTSLFGLEDAAMSAGAAQGDVAVIVREVPEGDSRPVAASSASAAAPASPQRSERGSGEGDTAGAPGRGEEEPARAEDPAPRPEARAEAPRGGDPEPAAPETRPVSNPAPAAGDCGLRLAMPVKGIETSPYGPRGGRNHDGLDIAAPTGTPIRAAECGVVTSSGDAGGYGNMVCVKHTDRLETCYAHMSRTAASAGQKVRKGQVIGYVGSTGNSTGPHLHFETRVDGQARDPKPYLRGSALPGRATVAASSSERRSSASGSRARGQRVSASSRERRAGTRTATVSRGGGARYEDGARSSGTRSTGGSTAAQPAPAPAQQAPVAAAPAEPAPAQTEAVAPAPAPVEPAPVPVEATPVEAAPVEPAPVEAAPVEPAPVEEVPVEPVAEEPVAPVEPAPVEEVPVEPVAEAPVAPVEPAPVEEVPVEPVAEAPVVPVDEAPVEPVIEEPVAEEPVAPVDAAPVEEVPVEPVAEEPVAPIAP